MDKLQWFKFSPSDWMMGKIQRCSEITQSRYIRLCCLYWNKECNLSIEDAQIEVDEEHYNTLVKKRVIKEVDGSVCIEFLDEQMDDITEMSKSKSKAARARWEKSKSKKVDSTINADGMHVHKDAMQNDAEKSKRREEERRGEKNKKKGVPPSFEDFISHARKKAKEKNIVLDEQKAKTKFDAWIENDWTDLKGNKILNWKVKITANINYWQATNNIGDRNPNSPTRDHTANARII